MKRRTSNMIASVLSIAALGMQALPICAETVGQETTIEVNTVQDFLNEYLSTKTEIIDVDGHVNVTYTPITQVDETNYWIVLSAKNFYDSLSANVVFMLNEQIYVPKSMEQINKDLALKQEIDQYFIVNGNYFALLVNDALAKDAEIKAAELARQEELANQENQEENTPKEEPKKEITFGSDSKVNTSNEDVEAEDEEVEEKEIVKVSAAVDVQINANNSQSLLDMAKPIVVEVEEVIEEEPSMALAVEEVLEPEIVSFVESEAVVLSLEEAAIEPLQTVEKEQTSSTAQSFVSTYLTSSSGNIFAQANNVNFQTILNSLSAWNKLSESDKTQVNSILMNKVGKNYQTLLQEAQTIKYGGAPIVNNGVVHTGVNTNAGLYAALCGLCAAIFGFITKKKEIFK